MRVPTVRIVPLVFAAVLASSTAFATQPQQRIAGPGMSPGIGDFSSFVIMDTCPGPIGSGWGIYGTSGWKVAQQFTPTLTTTPIAVGVPVSYNGFSTFTIQASIYTDAGGGIPGTLITGSVPVTVTGAPSYPAAVVAKIKFTTQKTLTAGMTYVLLFEAPTGACFVDANGAGACPGVALQTVDGGLTWPAVSTDVCRIVAAP